MHFEFTREVPRNSELNEVEPGRWGANVLVVVDGSYRLTYFSRYGSELESSGTFYGYGIEDVVAWCILPQIVFEYPTVSSER